VAVAADLLRRPEVAFKAMAHRQLHAADHGYHTGQRTAAIDTAASAAKLLADDAAGRCFICGLANQATTPAHEIVAYRDEHCVVFFPHRPCLNGYCLLASRRHITGVVSGFTKDDHLTLQQRIHRLGRIPTEIAPTERLCVFSFGSMQSVAHVHWRLAPLGIA
jgi:histidine triad (HIT) family protein